MGLYGLTDDFDMYGQDSLSFVDEVAAKTASGDN